MAEVTTQNRKINGGKSRTANRRSTRVDLTPMVDLGFLLITFFVFTTTMSEAKVMEMITPNNSDTTNDPICESCALTLLAGANNVLYYYEGGPEQAVYKKTSYSAEGIRDLIIQKKKKVFEKRGRDELMLIIKSGEGSTFKNLIDLVDESTISGIKKYYMDELTIKDKIFLNTYSQTF